MTTPPLLSSPLSLAESSTTAPAGNGHGRNEANKDLQQQQSRQNGYLLKTFSAGTQEHKALNKGPSATTQPKRHHHHQQHNNYNNSNGSFTKDLSLSVKPSGAQRFHLLYTTLLRVISFTYFALNSKKNLSNDFSKKNYTGRPWEFVCWASSATIFCLSYVWLLIRGMSTFDALLFRHSISGENDVHDRKRVWHTKVTQACRGAISLPHRGRFKNQRLVSYTHSHSGLSWATEKVFIQVANHFRSRISREKNQGTFIRVSFSQWAVFWEKSHTNG